MISVIKSGIKYDIVREFESEPIIDLYKQGGWWEENPKNRLAIPEMIKGSFCFMAVLYQGKLIGMGRVISDGASDGYIQDLIVLKEFRGLDIGRELVKRLTRYCVDQGLDWIGLIAEPGTEEFYQGMGFHVLKGLKPMRYQIQED